MERPPKAAGAEPVHENARQPEDRTARACLAAPPATDKGVSGVNAIRGGLGFPILIASKSRPEGSVASHRGLPSHAVHFGNGVGCGAAHDVGGVKLREACNPVTRSPLQRPGVAAPFLPSSACTRKSTQGSASSITHRVQREAIELMEI